MRDLFQHDILAERVAVKIIDIDQKKLSRPQAIDTQRGEFELLQNAIVILQTDLCLLLDL